MKGDLDPAELELWDELVLVVQRSLASYPADAARLAVNDTDFTMSVVPLRDGAASIQIDYCGTYGIYLEIGLTDAWIWQVDDTPLPAWLHRIVSGVMAGNFEEVGSLDASGRVRSPEGDISLGAALLMPLPLAMEAPTPVPPVRVERQIRSLQASRAQACAGVDDGRMLGR